MGTDELLSLLENVTEECMRVETAKQDSGPKVILGHLGPQVMSIPDRDQVLDTRDCLHGIRFRVFGRDLEAHGLDQVVLNVKNDGL